MDFMYIILLIILLLPYYLVAIFTFWLYKKHNKRYRSSVKESFVFSFLIYSLCIIAVVIANFQIYNFEIPGLNLREEDGYFYLMILPFVVILILSIRADYEYKQTKDETDY